MSRSLVFALLGAHLVAAAGTGLLEKRDAIFVPQRVNIPLSFDSLGRYVATVSMVSPLSCYPFYTFFNGHR